MQLYGRMTSTVNRLRLDSEAVHMPCTFGVAITCLGLVTLL